MRRADTPKFGNWHQSAFGGRERQGISARGAMKAAMDRCGGVRRAEAAAPCGVRSVSRWIGLACEGVAKSSN